MEPSHSIPRHVGRAFVEPEATPHNGWIISYADLMTIILTFMILLLSISTIAQTKFDLLVEALTGQKVGNLQEVKIKIDEVVQRESLGAEVMTNIDDRGLTIEFSNALLFESGEAELTERANAVFEPIARHLVHDLEPAYGLVIEGYTDDVPISNTRYKSNWELSTSRAIHVMEKLAEEGLERRRMSVQGFADTRAATTVDLLDADQVASLTVSELQEARAANRRVVIRIDRLHADVLERILPAADAPPVDPLLQKPAPDDIPGLGESNEQKDTP